MWGFYSFCVTCILQQPGSPGAVNWAHVFLRLIVNRPPSSGEDPHVGTDWRKRSFNPGPVPNYTHSLALCDPDIHAVNVIHMRRSCSLMNCKGQIRRTGACHTATGYNLLQTYCRPTDVHMPILQRPQCTMRGLSATLTPCVCQPFACCVAHTETHMHGNTYMLFASSLADL